MDIRLADKYTSDKLPLDVVLQLDEYLISLGSSLQEFDKWSNTENEKVCSCGNQAPANQNL